MQNASTEEKVLGLIRLIAYPDDEMSMVKMLSSAERNVDA